MLKKIKEAAIFSTTKSLYIIIFLLCALVALVSYESKLQQDYLLYYFARGGSKYKLCKTNQDLWIATIENDCISNEIEILSIWEQEVTNYLIKNIKPSETIIEIGANIGYYTTLLGKLVSKTGKVYSYEGNKKVYDLACLSLKMNDLTDIVTMKNVIVSDKEGFVDFVIYDRFNCGLSHIFSPKREVSNKEIILIKSVSLDEDLPRLKNVDWLRMDIEGSEILALRGMKRIINSSPNLKIVMEWDPKMLKNYGDVSQLIDDMHNYGFKFYPISTGGILGEELSKEYLLKEKEGLQDLVLLRN